MPQVEYSKDQPELFLKGIENKEKQIQNASDKLVYLLTSMGGVDEKLIEDIKAKVGECLSTRKQSLQEVDAERIRIANNTLDTLHKQYKESYNYTEETEKPQETPSNIERFCENFRDNIEGVSDIDSLINRLKNLISTHVLKINSDQTGKEILLDGLDYEIKILNLGNYSNKEYNIMIRNSSINPEISNYETDKDGMIKISSHCSEGRKVATQTDIQKILKNLVANYSLKSGREGDIHDEDIAFFMLMTQSDGEFLLKKDNLLGKNRVFKCYTIFRGFKDMKDDGTGQIILIRKKQ